MEGVEGVVGWVLMRARQDEVIQAYVRSRKDTQRKVGKHCFDEDSYDSLSIAVAFF